MLDLVRDALPWVMVTIGLGCVLGLAAATMIAIVLDHVEARRERRRRERRGGLLELDGHVLDQGGRRPR